MKRKILIVLITISALILAVGIIFGIGISTELIKISFNSGNISIDGSDFTGLFQIFASISSVALGIISILYSLAVIGMIWTIYGIVFLINQVLKKIKNKKNLFLFLIISILFCVTAPPSAV